MTCTAVSFCSKIPFPPLLFLSLPSSSLFIFQSVFSSIFYVSSINTIPSLLQDIILTLLIYNTDYCPVSIYLLHPSMLLTCVPSKDDFSGCFRISIALHIALVEPIYRLLSSSTLPSSSSFSLSSSLSGIPITQSGIFHNSLTALRTKLWIGVYI